MKTVLRILCVLLTLCAPAYVIVACVLHNTILYSLIPIITAVCVHGALWLDYLSWYIVRGYEPPRV